LSTHQPLVINGWNIFAHPLFLNQFEELLKQVEGLRQKYPNDYKQKNAAKRLAAIAKLAFDVIPQDPTRSEYRQGKFFQQYRLFFRYHLESKIIVFVWVNDDASKRSYESNTDAYRVFKKMLDSGHPPDDWNDLLKESKCEINRFIKLST